MCEIDWSIISNLIVAAATGFTGGVALYIYKMWSKQKESEVIANEAKAFIVSLAKLQALQSNIHRIIDQSGGYSGALMDIQKFKETRELMSSSATILTEALKNKEVSYRTSHVGSQALLFEWDIDEYLNSDKELIEVRFIDPEDARLISDIYLNFAMYRDSKKYPKNQT